MEESIQQAVIISEEEILLYANQQDGSFLHIRSAEKPPQDLMYLKGIEPEIFKESVDERYFCKLCEKVLRWPMHTKCGCRFCYSCLDENVRGKSGEVDCPSCHERFNVKVGIAPDRQANNYLKERLVYCTNKETDHIQACTLGDLNERKLDFKVTLIECLFHEEGCHDRIFPGRIAEHIQKECKFCPQDCRDISPAICDVLNKMGIRRTTDDETVVAYINTYANVAEQFANDEQILIFEKLMKKKKKMQSGILVHLPKKLEVVSLNSENQYEPSRNFTVLAEIGRGTYGTAWGTKDNKTNKEILTKAVMHRDLKNFRHFKKGEVEVPLLLKGNGTPQFYGAILKYTSEEVSAAKLTPGRSHCLLIMQEYLRGDTLADFLVKKHRGQPMKEEFCIQVAYQLLSTLKMAFDKGYSHLDIHARNVMFRQRLNIDSMIIDWGLSRKSSNINDHRKDVQRVLWIAACMLKGVNRERELWPDIMSGMAVESIPCTPLLKRFLKQGFCEVQLVPSAKDLLTHSIFDLYSPLGMESGEIFDIQLRSTLPISKFHSASRARLNTQSDPNGPAGAFAPEVDDLKQYVEVDLLRPTDVSGVVMQGRHGKSDFVTKYKVAYRMSIRDEWEYVKDSTGQDVVFLGNIDCDAPMMQLFWKCVKARFVRIHPVDWVNSIGFRFELLGHRLFADLYSSLGMESGEIFDSQFQSTLPISKFHSASRARLNTQSDPNNGPAGGFVPEVNDAEQHVQVDLLRPTDVSGVIMQGRHGTADFVTKYKVACRMTMDPEDEWEYVKDSTGQDVIFFGSVDPDTMIEHFRKPVQARYVRIQPVEWVGNIGFRFELLGRCFINTASTMP